MTKKLFIPALTLLLFAGTILSAGCERDTIADIDDTDWKCVLFWDGDPTNFDVRYRFNADGSGTMTDDTATHDLSWSNVNEKLDITVDIPGLNPHFVGTFDKQDIDGSMSDDNGKLGTWFGDRL